MERTSAGTAALLGLLTPVVAAGTAALLFDEGLTAVQVAGLVLALLALRAGHRPPAGGPVKTPHTEAVSAASAAAGSRAPAATCSPARCTSAR